MTPISTKLKIVRNTLTAVSKKVYHYARPSDITDCILWSEDAEDNSFDANNGKQEQIIHGTIDFFTKTEYHKTIDDIQSALTASPRIGWNLSSVQYEDETNLIHYEWEFWVV